MTDPMQKPRSCHLFLTHGEVVVLRDDFLNGGLRVGNNEEAEVLSLAQDGGDAAEVGQAILSAFNYVKVITALPKYLPGYVPPYVTVTKFASLDEFGKHSTSCGCIRSKEHKDKVVLYPIVYDPLDREFRQDRSKQVLSALDPSALGRTALSLLT